MLGIWLCGLLSPVSYGVGPQIDACSMALESLTFGRMFALFVVGCLSAFVVVKYEGVGKVASPLSPVPLPHLAYQLRPNNALHPTPSAGLYRFVAVGLASAVVAGELGR